MLTKYMYCCLFLCLSLPTIVVAEEQPLDGERLAPEQVLSRYLEQKQALEAKHLEEMRSFRVASIARLEEALATKKINAVDRFDIQRHLNKIKSESWALTLEAVGEADYQTPWFTIIPRTNFANRVFNDAAALDTPYRAIVLAHLENATRLSDEAPVERREKFRQCLNEFLTAVHRSLFERESGTSAAALRESFFSIKVEEVVTGDFSRVSDGVTVTHSLFMTMIPSLVAEADLGRDDMEQQKALADKLIKFIYKEASP